MEKPTVTLTILRGFNYSGKSEYARKLCKKAKGSTIIVNRDEITKAISSYWNPKVESLVNEIEESIIITALKRGQGVIIDDQNLSDKRERFIKHLIGDLDIAKAFDNIDYEIDVKYVDFRKPLIKVLINNLIKKVTFQKSMHPIALIYMYNNYKHKLVNGVK